MKDTKQNSSSKYMFAKKQKKNQEEEPLKETIEKKLNQSKSPLTTALMPQISIVFSCPQIRKSSSEYQKLFWLNCYHNPKCSRFSMLSIIYWCI